MANRTPMTIPAIAPPDSLWGLLLLWTSVPFVPDTAPVDAAPKEVVTVGVYVWVTITPLMVVGRTAIVPPATGALPPPVPSVV